MNLDKYDLFRQGIYIERMTPASYLQSMVRQLWPVKTRHKLHRYGSENDGGYLITCDLNDITACFSPGVDVNASFEKDLLDREGIYSHLLDYSVDAPPSNFKPKTFTKKYLGAVDSDKFTTLESWIRLSGEQDTEGDFILQMDIEGGEYLAILATPQEILKRFRIIVVEVHNVEAWGQFQFFEIAKTFFDKLLGNHYVLHNHPNNCCGYVNLAGFISPRVFELTLIRKDRGAPESYRVDFPHEFDAPNLPEREDLVLPEGWMTIKKL